MSYELKSIASIEGYGGFNDMPPNAKEISREEFDKVLLHGSYLFERIDYRQVSLDKGRALYPCNLFIYHDGTGVMHMSIYGPGKAGKYGHTSRYFKFAKCEHDMRGLSQAECREKGIYHGGRCYHVSQCTKCGYVNAYDSSD